MALQTRDFDYPLDEALIAQKPARRRDRSRLMVLRRHDGAVSHRLFSDLPALLRDGDVLVINNTRVIPARFACRRHSGGRIEGLFLRQSHPGQWEAMLRGAGRCESGEALALERCEGVRLVLCEDLGRGRWILDIKPPGPAEQILRRAGAAPLPPYIRRPHPDRDAQDRRRYQTVYASQPGAVAAPTAGLHFTRGLLGKLEGLGVHIVPVTLHVGLGTFAPVMCERPGGHEMHSEWYQVSSSAAEALNAARRDGRRIVAVGTTSVRVLETLASSGAANADLFAPADGWTNLFLHPPAAFHAVDALITNFHLPKSTLLMLVAAFCRPGRTDGIQVILNAYAQAARMRYRFYSYGDAMLIE